MVKGEAGAFPARASKPLLNAWELRRCWLLHRLRALDHASRFDFSAAAINCGDAIDTAEFRQLLDELGSMPVLLYGTPTPSYMSGTTPFLATSRPTHPEGIVKAVAGLLSS